MNNYKSKVWPKFGISGTKKLVVTERGGAGCFKNRIGKTKSSWKSLKVEHRDCKPDLWTQERGNATTNKLTRPSHTPVEKS